ncbi:MAG: hypothetical protein QOG35_1287, partial [Solirubrobacteraceae bacterium]|nr:hypothetical protein [Solirubrobacteraceae bacterium]
PQALHELVVVGHRRNVHVGYCEAEWASA